MSIGDRLGKYRLTRPLGSGAMGVVWAAVNEDTQREVALKLLRSPDPELRRRLLREAKACGRLEHRNVVTIHDIGTTPAGDPFLVMQLLAGETLAGRVARVGRLPPEIAAAIGASIAAGLAAAHAQGIVHRDLKPENVFLHREPGSVGEVVKIVDFGVSRLDIAGDAGGTATGMLIGSPAYMSPEQARGHKLDARSDIWSLGVVLFEMLTAARPFPGPSVADAMVQVLAGPIPEVAALVPGVPRGLSALVGSCLTRELGRRPSQADRLGMALLSYATTATGQHERVELPSLSGAGPEESTRLITSNPHFNLASTVLLKGSEDDDERRATVPMPPIPVPEPLATLPVPEPAPGFGWPPPPPSGAPSSSAPSLGGAPSSGAPYAGASAIASSSTVPLSHVTLQRAPRSKRAMALAASVIVVVVAVVGGVAISRRGAPEAVGSAPPDTVPTAASGSATPQPPPAQAPTAKATPSASAAAPEPPRKAAEPTTESPAAVAVGHGVMRINSRPVSKVALDGQPLGSTPRVDIRVASGPHVVLFVYPNGEHHTTSTYVLPGTVQTVTDRLEVKPPPP
jgi:serine/threonine protein kinase